MTGSTQTENAIVTGATGAIGSAIARQIAAQGYNLTIIARDRRKAEITVNQIIHSTGNHNVNFEIVDLALASSIQALAINWRKPLQILVNNAAVTPKSRQETAEGLEMQFATNVLGYFRMTAAFKPFLKAGSPARVVDVASYWAGDLQLDDLEFKIRPYRNGAAYRQSKQANRMLVVAWAERLLEDGIQINACHPGDVNSTLSNNLGFGGHQSPDQGAETPVWLAISPEADKFTGRYFENFQEVKCRYGRDQGAVKALFNTCLSYSLPFSFSGQTALTIDTGNPHILALV